MKMYIPEIGDAKILLDNGSEVNVNQVILKPGDDFCVNYIRK